MGGNPSSMGKNELSGDLRKVGDLTGNIKDETGEERKGVDRSDRDVKKFKFIQFSQIPNVEDSRNYGILPLNVIHKILLFLPAKDHLEATISSKLFYKVGNTVLFWKDYCENVLGSEFVEKKEEENKDKDEGEVINYKRLFYLRSKFLDTKDEEYYKRLYNIENTHEDRKDWEKWRKKVKLMKFKTDDEFDDFAEDSYSFKVCVAGPTMCGKTSLVLRFVRNQFFEAQEATIGAAFLTQTMGPFKFDIWDTAGQIRFRSLVPMYYRGSRIILACFSLSDRKSFEEDFKTLFLTELLKVREDLLFVDSKGETRKRKQGVILVGMKSDLPEEERKISYDEIVEICVDSDFDNYVECSAKTGEGVHKVFGMVAEFFEKNFIEH